MVLSLVNKILDWITSLVLYSIFIYGSTRFIIENLDEKEEDVRRITEPFTGIEFNIRYLYVPCATILTLATEKFWNLLLLSSNLEPIF